MIAKIVLLRLRGGCKECLSGEDGSLASLSGDRKRGTGGRSRTLAPPRGAAWIVDYSLASGLCKGVGDELDAWDARRVSLLFLCCC
jgi:hypothetical protein